MEYLVRLNALNIFRVIRGFMHVLHDLNIELQ